MGYWELYKNRIIIASFSLCYIENEVEIEEKLDSTFEADKLLTLLWLFQIQMTFWLVDSPSLLAQFLNFLTDLQNDDFERWRTFNKLPLIDKYEIYVFKNEPFVEESPENRGKVKSEIDQLAISTYILIHLWEKLTDKLAARDFLTRLLTEERLSKKLNNLDWHEAAKPIVQEKIGQLYLD